MEIKANTEMRPSNLERAMACPGGHLVIEQLQHINKGGDIPGHLLHALVASKVINRLGLSTTDTERDTIAAHINYYHNSMARADADTVWRAAERGADFVTQAYHTTPLPAVVEIEKPITLPKAYNEVNNGRPDYVIRSKEFAHIIDLKYGQRVRNHETQMMAYALGVVTKYPEIRRLCLTVYYPNITNASVAQIITTAEDVLRWAIDSYGPTIAAMMEDDAKACPGGHCMACPAAGVCRQRGKWLQEMFSKEPVLLDNDELDELMTILIDSKEYVDTYKKEIIKRLCRGEQVGGWWHESNGGREIWDKDKQDRNEIISICKANGVNPARLYTNLCPVSHVREKLPGLYKALKERNIIRVQTQPRLKRPESLAGVPIQRRRDF